MGFVIKNGLIGRDDEEGLKDKDDKQPDNKAVGDKQPDDKTADKKGKSS